MLFLISTANLTIFLDDFFRKCQQFCSILETSDDIIYFSNRISHQNSPRCIEKFNYHMLFSDQHRQFDEFFGDLFDDFFSESGGNFALQRAPLLTEFSEIALRSVTHVIFMQTALYDVPCGYLELFNY